MKRVAASASLVLVIACSLSRPWAQGKTAGNDRFDEEYVRDLVPQGELTTGDIAEKRDLSLYDDGGHADLRQWGCRLDGDPSSCSWSVQRRDLVHLREFIRTHWLEHRRGYIRVSGDSVDASWTSHIFIEPAQGNEWRIAWRVVKSFGVFDRPDAVVVETGSCDRKDGSCVLILRDRGGAELEKL